MDTVKKVSATLFIILAIILIIKTYKPIIVDLLSKNSTRLFGVIIIIVIVLLILLGIDVLHVLYGSP